MFVRQAYEKRLKKQEDDINKQISLRKHSQPKIGSIKNDKINYDREEQFFSKDDIPEYAKTIKQQVKHFIDPDHLGLRKKEWNTSVSVPKNVEQDETHQQKLLKIKLGFFDHPLPKYKQPKIYDGTELRDDYTKWNVSNQVIKAEIKENLLKKTQAAFQNTKLKETQMMNTYVNPLARTISHIQSFKDKVEGEAEKRQKLKENYIFENPTASEEKINGAVFRLAYQSAVKQKKDEIESLTMKTDFRATLSNLQKSKITKQAYHTGIWQKFTAKTQEQQDYYGWSCCMSQDFAGVGCSKVKKDGNKWNLTSFNNS